MFSFFKDENEDVGSLFLFNENESIDNLSVNKFLGMGTIPKQQNIQVTITESDRPSNIKPSTIGDDAAQSQMEEMKGEQKLAEKRNKDKVRAKRARDRKKRYIEELEMQVKELKTENAKLNMIIQKHKITDM